MSQEEQGLLVTWHRDEFYTQENVTLLGSNYLFHSLGVMEPVLVRTQTELDYINAMGLMNGKTYRADLVSNPCSVAAFRASTFITIDLTSLKS